MFTSELAGKISSDEWEREAPKRLPWIAKHPEHRQRLEAFELAKESSEGRRIRSAWLAIWHNGEELWQRWEREGKRF